MFANVSRTNFGLETHWPNHVGEGLPPDERTGETGQTTAIAESPEAAAPGDIARGPQQAAETRAAGMGQPRTGEVGAGERPNTEPIGVAAKYTEEELGQGSVQPGTVKDDGYSLAKGDAYINSGQDPRIPVRAAMAGRVSPHNVGVVSTEEYATLSAGHERLVNDAVAKQR